MTIDDFFSLFIDNFYIVVLVVIIVKLFLSFWYKPHRPSFIWKSFFRIYSKKVVSSRKNSNWPVFKMSHNFLTVILYSVIFFKLVLAAAINLQAPSDKIQKIANQMPRK